MLEESETLAPNMAKAISLSTAQWDEANNAFKNAFEVSTGETLCNYINYSNVLDYDAFTLTWRPLPGVTTQDISTFEEEQVVMGLIVVYIPAVVFSGSETCSDIVSIVNENCFT